MRYKMIFSYDGSRFSGFQRQIDVLTVQGLLEEKLSQINSNNFVNVVGSGRTDAGVHAIRQCAHFDLNNSFDIDVLKRSLNNMISPFIYINSIEIVDNDFHARFGAKKREYIYKINMGDYSVFDVDYVYQLNRKLDVNRMIEESKNLIGENDFKVFSKVDSIDEKTIRRIYDIEFEVFNDILSIKVLGNGFLRHMIRGIVGTLIEIGMGSKINIKEILNTQNKDLIGSVINGCGLYLNNVEY